MTSAPVTIKYCTIQTGEKLYSDNSPLRTTIDTCANLIPKS